MVFTRAQVSKVKFLKLEVVIGGLTTHTKFEKVLIRVDKVIEQRDTQTDRRTELTTLSTEAPSGVVSIGRFCCW